MKEKINLFNLNYTVDIHHLKGYVINQKTGTNTGIKKMTKTIRLQQVGIVQAKEAAEFSIGEKVMYNLGHTAKIIGIKKASKCFLAFSLVDSEAGEYVQKFKTNRLVAFA